MKTINKEEGLKLNGVSRIQGTTTTTANTEKKRDKAGRGLGLEGHGTLGSEYKGGLNLRRRVSKTGLMYIDRLPTGYRDPLKTVDRLQYQAYQTENPQNSEDLIGKSVPSNNQTK